MQFSAPNELSQACVNQLVLTATENNIGYLDTAEFYGPWQADGPVLHKNEQTLGAALQQLPEELRKEILVGTKCGLDFRNGQFQFRVSEEQINQSIEQSQQALGMQQLQLLMIHRLDPTISDSDFESLLHQLLKLTQQGKVELVGFSEPTAQQIRTAHAILGEKLFAVEIAYSVFIRRAEVNGVIDACRELDIEIIAYSTLMRGLFKNNLSQLTFDDCQRLSKEDLRNRLFDLLSIQDYRCQLDFFSDKNLRRNIVKLKAFHELAAENNLLPMELAILWLIDKGILPIPGFTQVEQLLEYTQLQQKQVDTKIFAQVDEQFPHGCFTGDINPPIFNAIENSTLNEVMSTHSIGNCCNLLS